MLPSSIVETCLHVADLACSREFYSRLFAYPVMNSDQRFCAYQVGPGKVLLLFQRGSDPTGTRLPFGFIPPHHATGQSHVGFSIPAESLAAWRGRLAEQAIAIESELKWPGGGTSLYFRDPDQHLLELLTPRCVAQLLNDLNLFR